MSLYKANNAEDGEPGTSDGNYRWETGYEKTWEAIKEDNDGTLQASIDQIRRAKKRLQASRVPNTRLGMMRHLFVILDGSTAMDDKDLHPNRWKSALKLLEGFVESYFDQNPISQLGIIVSSGKRAEKVSELGGNPERHVSSLKNLGNKECGGEFSLQNSLDMALQTLKHVPSHTSKEILVVMGSLTTCDPGNVLNTIASLKQNTVRCSVIGLAAEVRICKTACSETQGAYGIILDESHFKDILMSHAIPQASAANVESSLMKMGFPSHYSVTGRDKPSMCVCHQDTDGGPNLTNKGYICPQCQSKYCELPIECQICGLILVSAPHLARSYHHLFPIKVFDEENPQSEDLLGSCCSCQAPLKNNPALRCPNCLRLYCFECDIFIHEMLHSCPTCSSDFLSMSGVS